MKFLKMIFPVMSMSLLVACSSGSDSSGSSQNTETICGGSLAISRGPVAPNRALIRATVLDIRSNTTGTILNLYITESHDIFDGSNAVTANREIEARTDSQMLDINVNDTITAFLSLVGDECGSALIVSSVVKMPNATDGAPDTMTVTVSGPSGTVTTAYTEGPYNAQDNLAPVMISFVTASINTQIQLHSGGSNTQGATSLSIAIGGSIPQSYTLGGVNARNSITYSVFDTQHQPYTGVFLSTSGTVTLSSIGNVGEKIIGDFDAVFTNLTNTSETLAILGTFSVTRDN